MEEFSSISEDRLYVIPKFIVAHQFHDVMFASLETSKGLPQIWMDVFNEKDDERWKELRITFFDLVITTGIDSVLTSLDEIVKPTWKFRTLRQKIIRRDSGPWIRFWGQNSALKWKDANVKGHYFIRKSAGDPGKEVVSECIKKSTELDSQLVQLDVLELGRRVEKEIFAGKISSETRENISIKT